MIGAVVAAVVLLAVELAVVQAAHADWRRTTLAAITAPRDRTTAVVALRRRTVRIVLALDVVLGVVLVLLVASTGPVVTDPRTGRLVRSVPTSRILVGYLIVALLLVGGVVGARRICRRTYEVARQLPAGALRPPLGVRLLTVGTSLLLVGVNEAVVLTLPRAWHIPLLLGSFAVALALLAGPGSVLQIRARGGEPMAASEAAEVHALAAEMGVRLRGVYVYRQRRARIAQAMQVGVLPGGRRVLFSDVLWEDLPPEQRRAVAAHELAHAARRHLLKLVAAQFAFFGLYLLALVVLLRGLSIVVVVPLWVATFLLAPRALSRRFEVEADRVGAAYTSCADMAAALGSIEVVNDAPRPTGRGLLATHPHISRRQALLLAEGG